MRKARTIAVCLFVVLFGLATLWGKGKDKQTKKEAGEETYLGPISCTVTTFKEAPPPIPVGDLALQNLGNNAAPQNPRDSAAPQNSGKNAAPQNPGNNGAPQAPPANGVPQGPAGDGTPQNPAVQNLSLTKPVVTLQDCLTHGGQVVLLPDGAPKPIFIENPDAIKGHEWHRLSISGFMRGAAFHIISVRII
jgi:hypothetical protein